MLRQVPTPQHPVALSDDEFGAWFRLLETPGLGRETTRRLLAACGSPAAVLGAAPSTLRELVGKAHADKLAAPPPDLSARLAAAQHWRRAAGDHHVLTLGDPAYPARLLESPDPPLLLYVEGRIDALHADSIAVVGSRHASAQGLDNARGLARALSDQGLLVVSGLALGIDGAAHEGALAGRAGTLAVLGTGLDRIYPAQHRGLARRIAEQGALVSEFAPGTPGLPEHFPQRNRIIAGLTLGTLVVEAALQSGSLITARLALEAGREVFAVPGSIHAPQSKGCHALIQQGAKLVQTAADIVEELRPAAARPGPRPVQASGAKSASAADPADRDTPEDPLLAALGFDPTTLDALIDRSGWPASELTVRLLELELAGRARRLPGGLYQRCAWG